MGADRNQWQFPRNVAGNLLGWRDDGKGMKNFDAEAIRDLLNFSDSSGSSLVGFTQDEPDAVERTVQDKLMEHVSALDFGAIGNGIADDTSAIEKLIACSSKNIDFGDASLTYRVTRTIVESSPDRKWLGAATIKLDRAGQKILPLLDVKPTATNFYCSPTLVFDHNAVGIAQPSLANQPAFAICCAVLLQADGFDFSCRVLNSWDSGVAVIRITFTGDGETTPYTGTQTPGFPQSWRIGSVYGENCGCGVHDGSFGETGKKGPVVNVLTGSDGVVESVTGKSNYGGLVVDFAGGGEAAIGETAFTGTLLDVENPNNGSGIDHYFGSGQITAAALKSDNAARLGLAISPDAGVINVNARIHASGKEGARIEGGRVSGIISISDASQDGSNLYDALYVQAGTADIWLNLLVTVTGPSGGPLHKYSYSSQHSGSFRVRGMVGLVSQSAVTGPYSRGSVEVLKYGEESACSILGAVGLGMRALLGTSSAAFVAGDVSLASPTGGTAINLYFDSGWKYLANGYGALIRVEPGGGISFYVAPNNASGAGAAASLVNATSMLANGNTGINEASPDYKLDVNGTFGFTPGASVTPVDNGDVVFQLTSNTQFTIKAKGSDGVVRSGNITLA